MLKMPEPLKGVFAALPTPLKIDGRVDEAILDRIVDFVIGAGVQGVCVGGATGEYPHFEAADRKAIVQRVAARLPRDRSLLVGIGASSMRRTLELGQAALDAGSHAVLLPMPMFFRYAQPDLAAYCVQVSEALRGRCLLYDLPDFTNGLAPETSLSLLEKQTFIVGIKDSSGRPDNLSRFADARGDRDWTLLVGDDRLLHAGLLAGWNGGVSGVAGFCPELILGLVQRVERGDREEALRWQALLDELITRMSVLPVPWAIRVGLAARGIDTGPLPLPLTSVRREQIRDFQTWFSAWLTALPIVAIPTSSNTAASR
jgi:4-hydroxy-tetrahydrodipicolinate synthase